MVTVNPLFDRLQGLGRTAPVGQPQGLLHQSFQTGQLAGSRADTVVQMQMLLLQVLGPLLQQMLTGAGPGGPSPYADPLGGGAYGGGAVGGDVYTGPAAAGGAPLAGVGGQTFGPTVPGQSFGGVDGFFRDVAAGLTGGSVGTAGPGASGSTGGAYGGLGPYPGPGAGSYGPSAPAGPSGPTPGYGTPGTGGGPEGPANDPIPTDLDYRDLSKEQRRALSGMSDRERAILHLWGIQMTSKGSQDGGVLLNVLENPSSFQDAEVELARELIARDEASYGGLTGRALDEEFFGLYENITGKDISGRYADAPIQFASGPLDMENRLTGDNGLNAFENQVLQLWGHSPLFNGGRIDGNIVDYALASEHALEANLNRGDLEALRAADLASDGVLNGDSLENAFIDTLDRLYLGGPGASAEKTMNDALAEAALRREGLLPPPEPGSDPSAIEALPPGHGPVGGGGVCPFLQGAA